MEERVGASYARRRFNTLLLGSFAAVAVVLACVGIYGVMSFMVSQRSREIGLRVALGAKPARVLGMVVGRSAVLTAAAVGVGIVGAGVGTRVMSSLLFGVGPLDVVTFISTTLVVCAVALGAAYLPARRATKVDPIIALRND